MIAVKYSGNYIAGALLYNNKKEKNSEASVLATNIFFNTDAESLAYRFQRWNSKNPNVKVNCLHYIISLDKSDKVDNHQFKNLSQEFMNEIGFANQPYIVYLHNDRKHSHVHIVTTPIDKNGNRITDSNDYYTMMKASRKLEKSYGLVSAVHKKSRGFKEKFAEAMEKSVERPQPITDLKELEVRNDITTVMDYVLKNELFSNEDEYLKRLEDFNIGTKRIGERERFGFSHYIQDENGKQITKAIKNSRFKPTLHLNKFKRVYEKKNNAIHTHKKELARLAKHILKKYDKISPQTYLTEMSAYGIKVQYNYAEGKINGIGYFDESKHYKFKGSDFGFGAKELNLLFQEKDILVPILSKDAINEDKPDWKEEMTVDRNIDSFIYSTDNHKKVKDLEEKKKKRKKPRL